MTEPQQESIPTEPAPTRRRRRRWPYVLGFLAVAIYCAPWILSIEGVADSVTAQAMPWLPPGSDIGQPTLGWMSPVHLAGLKILDDQGRLLLECDHVTSKKSLWEMATHPGSPGGWVLEKPRAVLYVNPTGCSLNPILERFLARKKRVKPLNFDVTVDDGRIEFLDPAEKPLATIAGVSANYASETDRKSFQATGALTEGSHSGKIDLSGQWTVPADPEAIPTAEVRGGIDHLPLSLFEPWLNSHTTIASVDGAVAMNLNGSITPSAAGPVDATLNMAFTPRDAVYRKQSEDKFQPVPASQLALAGDWETQTDAITFRTLTVQSGGISLSGSGTIQNPRGAGLVDLRAAADQDISGLLELLSPEIRSHIKVQGLRVRNFAVTGALWPDRYIATSPGETPPPPATLAGDVTWTQAVVYGVEATPGAVTAALQPSGIALWPRDVRVGDGELKMLPRVELVEHRQFVAEPGPMLVDVNLTPEMCREWLKFISPVLADATDVKGKVTLLIESGQIPFTNPGEAAIAGAVRVHTAQVTPGPLARQAIDSAATLARMVTGKSPAWAERDLQIELPQQDIQFRVQDGRVYHRGMTFRAGELAVQTRGSVGLDHSLDLLVEIPLPEAWIERRPALQGLRGELVTIPVQGTLERPRVDGRAIAEMGKRIGAGAAGGLLQNLLDRAIDKAAEKDRRRSTPRNAP